MAARAPTTPTKGCRPPSQPQGWIRIVVGGELRPSKGVTSSVKGKGKDVASLGVPPPVERPTTPPPPPPPPFPRDAHVIFIAVRGAVLEGLRRGDGLRIRSNLWT